MTVCVVSDPSAVIPAAWRRDRPLLTMPIDVVWRDGTTDAGDLPYETISERLAREPVPPTTGAPAPGRYAEMIGGLLGSHDGVLVVCPSSELSGTYQSATIGAREVDDPRVRVLDSKTAAAGQGIVAAEAARRAAAGATLDEVSERALDVASRIRIWATLSQLDFLRRSGRVPAVVAMGAGALGLQPVVRYAGGSPSPVGFARSTTAATDRLFRAWERSAEGGHLVAVAFHSGRAGDAASLAGRIGDVRAGADVHAIEVTASLASHTGPGLLGLAWCFDGPAATI